MNQRLNVFWTAILILSLMLAGCWDQRLLRDHSLILSIGYDRAENEDILKTITFPKNTSASGGGGKENTSLQESKVLSKVGDTVKDAERHMEQSIPEKFDRSKARVIFFGEELASEGIFSTLDSVYRDLRGPLNAYVAIFNGKAKDALTFNEDKSILTSDLYAELLDSAGKAGIIKNENVQTACPIILTEGKDIVLPYLSFNKESAEAEIEGVALFDHDIMTGKLNTEETSMFLILADQITRSIALNLKVSNNREDPNKNFVNIAIHHDKRKLKVTADKEQVSANIHVKLSVEIDEYASDELYDKHKLKVLGKEIEKQLNELAGETLGKMQEANNDALGIGEKVKAYHHAIWDKIEWEKEYPNIPIETTFDVKIVRHGIIN